jgi:hypothetical protein
VLVTEIGKGAVRSPRTVASRWSREPTACPLANDRKARGQMKIFPRIGFRLPKKGLTSAQEHDHPQMMM